MGWTASGSTGTTCSPCTRSRRPRSTKRGEARPCGGGARSAGERVAAPRGPWAGFGPGGARGGEGRGARRRAAGVERRGGGNVQKHQLNRSKKSIHHVTRKNILKNTRNTV